jgi:hypothetical protein
MTDRQPTFCPGARCFAARRFVACMGLAFALGCGGGSGSQQGLVANHQADATLGLRDGVGKLALTGCVGFDYMAAFNVGGQTLNLLVDSGSTTFGVAGKECSACTPANGVQQLYALSSTGKRTGAFASSTYADGSKWSGVVVSDQVAAGDAQVLATPAVSVNFADITSESNFFEPVTCAAADDTAFDGIAGLGPDGQLLPRTTSFMTALAQGGQLKADLFAMQMCDVGGWLWFGGWDANSATAAPNFAPLVQADSAGYFVAVADMALGGTSFKLGASKLGPMVVDSGTNAIFLTKSAYAAFQNTIEGSQAFVDNFGSNFISAESGSCAIPAKGLTREQLDAQLPRFSLTLQNEAGGTFAIDMPATSSYLVAHADPTGPVGSTYYCPAVAGNTDDSLAILGNAAMRQFVVIFDRTGSGRIGFAPQTGCKPASMYLPPGT